MKRKFIYKKLIELGFKRFDMGDGFDIQGYEDFYLHLKSQSITFEWYPAEFNEVRMVRYDEKDIDVQNVIIIEDMDSLNMMLNFFNKKKANKDKKPRLSKKEECDCSKMPMYA